MDTPTTLDTHQPNPHLPLSLGPSHDHRHSQWRNLPCKLLHRTDTATLHHCTTSKHPPITVPLSLLLLPRQRTGLLRMACPGPGPKVLKPSRKSMTRTQLSSRCLLPWFQALQVTGPVYFLRTLPLALFKWRRERRVACRSRRNDGYSTSEISSNGLNVVVRSAILVRYPCSNRQHRLLESTLNLLKVPVRIDIHHLKCRISPRPSKTRNCLSSHE